MDPQIAPFTPRGDEYWRMQTDMLRVQQVQADHNERLNRLERRLDEDARVRSVWGTSSPFPGVLSGTPQQGPVQAPPSETFPGFDDSSGGLLGSLQLDGEDEPRRAGATSRANSVRFDETANQGHWAQASRSSIDIIPRAGSGLGHPMTERSYSHKSDGRQSSAGHSVHSAVSGRANSLGLDTSYGIGHTTASPVETPGLAPGMFILGPVPAIIRCWLNTDFRNDSLLYAAVCTASYISEIDYSLVKQLDLVPKISHSEDGTSTIKLTVHLPEAIQRPPSSRSSSPAPQVPSITVNFRVAHTNDDLNPMGIQIFLGSDTLRAHNADVLFSSNRLSLYDDDHSKLSIQLVRPEDDQTFRSLHVTHNLMDSAKTNAESFPELSTTKPKHIKGAFPNPGGTGDNSSMGSYMSSKAASSGVSSDVEHESAPGSGDGIPAPQTSSHKSISRPSLVPLTTSTKVDADGGDGATRSGNLSSRSGPSSAIWSNWRKESDRGSQSELGAKSGSSSYHRREQGIKVLKPSKPTLRSMSGSQATLPSTSSRSNANDEWKGSVSNERPEEVRAAIKSAKDGSQSSSGRRQSSNPVGTGSAFSWLNSGMK